MENTTDSDGSLEKLRDLMKDINFCMLTTLDDDGCLRSRPMSTNGEVEANGDLWFFIRKSGKNPAVQGGFAGATASLLVGEPAQQPVCAVAPSSNLTRSMIRFKHAKSLPLSLLSHRRARITLAPDDGMCASSLQQSFSCQNRGLV